jgi:hypothetical protein
MGIGMHMAEERVSNQTEVGGMHMVKECVLNQTEVEGMDMMSNDA